MDLELWGGPAMPSPEVMAWERSSEPSICLIALVSGPGTCGDPEVLGYLLGKHTASAY